MKQNLRQKNSEPKLLTLITVKKLTVAKIYASVRKSYLPSSKYSIELPLKNQKSLLPTKKVIRYFCKAITERVSCFC
jgi:hypothetical protein